MTELVPLSPTWVDVISPAVNLAERISRTDFVPTALRGRPEAVLACILTGHEIGIGPMASLAKIAIIEGRPTMAAELMRALGLSAGHEYWVEEATDTRVIVAGRRHGSDHVTKVTWTRDQATKAGLAGRQNWQRYPRAMLLARATAELARLVWPDALGGVAYATEELEDTPELSPSNPVAKQEATPEPNGQTRRRRAPLKPVVPPIEHQVGPALPPLPGELEPEPGPPAPQTISDPQRKKMHALYREAGLDDRDARLEFATVTIDRVINSSAELTVDEASAVIDRLERITSGAETLDFDDEGRIR